MGTTAISPAQQSVEILPPHFYFGWRDENNKCWIKGGIGEVGGFVQSLACSLPNTCRHISTAEFSQFMESGLDETQSRDFNKKRLFAATMLSYILERGVNVEEDYIGRSAIYLNDGLILNGDKLTIVKNIEKNVEEVIAYTWAELTVGYKIKDQSIVESETFSIERVFRKFDPENLSLKNLDKSNPDAVEYLFGKPFEQLPQPVQESSFILPPDFESREYSGVDIWNLSVDIAFKLEDTKPVAGTVKKTEISNLIMRQVTFTPFQHSCGFHIIAKDPTLK